MPKTTDEDIKLARDIVALVLRDEEAAWNTVAQLLATYREHHHHEGVMSEIRRPIPSGETGPG